jgi:hypothetical protein
MRNHHRNIKPFNLLICKHVTAGNDINLFGYPSGGSVNFLTDILLFLVLFTVTQVIYSSITTDDLNYTLSTLINKCGAFKTIDIDDLDCYFCFGPLGLSIPYPARFANFNRIDQLANWIWENYSPGLINNLFETALNATGATVVLGGITLCTVTAAAVVLLAASLCIFRLTHNLQQDVSTIAERRSAMVELANERNNLTPEIFEQELERVGNIGDHTNLNRRLADCLEDMMEYFGEALDHLSPTDVYFINTTGLHIREGISEFLSTINSLVPSMIRDFESVQLTENYGWFDDVEILGSDLNNLLEGINIDFTMLLNLLQILQ